MTASVDRTRFRDWLLAIAVGVAILAASVVRVPGEPSPTPGPVGLTDPFHLVGYAALAVAVALALSKQRELTRDGHVAAVAVAVATLFGVGVELVQAPIPWRSFAVADAAINALGAVVGVAVLGGWRRWRRWRR
ncbi:VanZ family protein [Haloparvum sp. PAK95]|uniref:VanZ family protein n=1 Tax=Haloparvum sp. PAK95 TaxID=3418962 RepID=UPI003D2E9E42